MGQTFATARLSKLLPSAPNSGRWFRVIPGLEADPGYDPNWTANNTASVTRAPFFERGHRQTRSRTSSKSPVSQGVASIITSAPGRKYWKGRQGNHCRRVPDQVGLNQPYVWKPPMMSEVDMPALVVNGVMIPMSIKIISRKKFFLSVRFFRIIHEPRWFPRKFSSRKASGFIKKNCPLSSWQ